MTEFIPAIRPLNHETFLNNIDKRVKEADMRTHEPYSFVAQLDLTSFGEISEFKVQLDQVIRHEMGKASLLLCVFDASNDETLLYMNASSDDGIVAPLERNRLAHPRLGNIGVITHGYLLESPAELSLRAQTTLHELDSQADPRDYRDTRTSAFSSEGIYLGSD